MRKPFIPETTIGEAQQHPLESRSGIIPGLLLFTIALSPGQDSLVNLIPRHPIAHQKEGRPQFRLDIAIPRLVVEEEHILVRNPACMVDFGKVLRLVGREDLNVVKILERTNGFGAVGRWIVGKGGNDVECFEHVAGQIRGMGS